MSQPDGSRITVCLRGDEKTHWHEDGNGYLVQKSPQTGHWVYAEETNGAIIPTNHIVGKEDPARIGIRRPNISRIVGASTGGSTSGAISTLAAAQTGTMRNLVILVNFADLTIPYTRQQFDDLFNQLGYTADGAVGSVKDYYGEVSYNQLTVNSTVVEPVTLNYGYAYYGANSASRDIRPQDMVKQAIAKLDARGFDFRTVDGDGDGWVDGLTIIHAGGGEEYSGNDPNYIWSHSSSLFPSVKYDGIRMQRYHTEPARRGFDSNSSTWGITRIGVICHENAHFLGLPDLYDTGYDSSGVGKFCLMASGSWGGGDGRRPSHLSAWCKVTLGWVTPTTVSTPGVYSLPQVETNPRVCKLQGAFPAGQYFLVENRQGVGFDAALPGSSRGLLIWHVDESMANNDNQTHYKVDLEEASGAQHLELAASVDGDDADYFRSNTLTSFTQTTVPNDLSYSGVPLGLPIVNVSASGPTMTFFQGTDATPPAGNILINSGAAYASSTTVTLHHSAADASGVASMMCSNDGVNWTSWIPYLADESWSLAGGDGPKTVYARYKDNAGNVSTTYSDGVTLDTTGPSVSAPTDDGAYTGSATVTFHWVAGADSGSGIKSYNCRIGTAPGADDIFNGDAGNVLSKTITGTNGLVYYCSVEAVDNAGNAGPWSANSDGIAVVNNPGISIAAAKTLPDLSTIGLSLRAVTAVFGNCIYVEESGRNAAVRVVPTLFPAGLQVGSLVDVGGTIKTSVGERYIEGVVMVRG